MMAKGCNGTQKKEVRKMREKFICRGIQARHFSH